MKSIIIFSTKYGCAEKTAKMLQSKMKGDVRMVNIVKDKVPALDEFDAVILGGSIYMGRIQKELTAFISGNLPALLKKKVGLFKLITKAMKGDKKDVSEISEENIERLAKTLSKA